ncbi:MAG: AraC family ligand binding domain-containing protein [Frankiaceae bacterium]
MAARIRHGAGSGQDAATLLAQLAADGWLNGYAWGNGPGEHYGEHSHHFDKALYCVSGTVVFRTADGDVALGPGDRLDLDRNTLHSAQVGPEGVRCIEAHRP